MTLTRRSLVAGALAAPAVLAASRALAASRTLTVASLLGEDKAETLIWKRIAETVAQRLPGRFDFRVVANAALGGEKEVAEGIRLGSIQASLFTVSALTNWVPEAQILDLPFLFRDRAHVKRAVKGPVGGDLARRFAAEGFQSLGYVNYGARHLLAKEPVTTPDAVKGKKIRVIQSPLHVELWKAYGALPTPLPIPETYNALKSGVVDMMDLTRSAYVGFRLYEVVPVLVETAHIWASGVAVIAAPFWATLTPEEKEVLRNAIAAATSYFDELILADEAAAAEVAAKAGGRSVPVEDRDAWVKGARGVWQMMADKVGGLDRVEALAAL